MDPSVDKPLTFFGASLVRHTVADYGISLSGIDPEDGAEYQVRRALPTSRTTIQGIR